MEVLLIVGSSFFESLTLEESLILIGRHRLVEAFLFLGGILPLENFLLSRDSCREPSSRLEFACSYETALVVMIFRVIDSSFVENAVLSEAILMVKVIYHIS